MFAFTHFFDASSDPPAAVFTAVEVGIAGERYFEVTSGLKEGDRVITGPFESVRNLFDADEVRENRPAASTAK